MFQYNMYEVWWALAKLPENMCAVDQTNNYVQATSLKAPKYDALFKAVKF